MRTDDLSGQLISSAQHEIGYQPVEQLQGKTKHRTIKIFDTEMSLIIIVKVVE